MMDQREAQRRFAEGAFIICLDIPTRKGFQIGIDSASWTVGEKFKGLKMIPSGLHYIYYRVTGDISDVSILSDGFFHYFKPQEVLALGWNSASEEFDFIQDAEQVDGLRANLFELDRFLGPFPFDQPAVQSFANLTKYITPSILDRVLPDHRVSSTRESFGFCQIPIKKQLAPTDILDTSRILDDDLISGHFNGEPEGVLGELQLSFIIFWLGSNYEGFDQWKSLLSILCRATHKIASDPKYYRSLVRLVHGQMAEFPFDFFQGTLAEENLLYKLLYRLIDDCRDSDDKDLVDASNRLASLLSDRFGWNVSRITLLHEEGEDAPIIVE